MSESQIVSDPNWGAAPPPAASASAGAPARDAHGYLRGSTVTTDTPDPLLAMLGPLAHPQTLTDFARILMVPVDSVKKAAASALAMRIGPGVAGTGLSATGRGIEKVGSALEGAKAGQAAGLIEAVTSRDPVKSMALAATPTVLKFAGRGLQKVGGALSGEMNAISAAEEAQLLKQGYSPQVIAKMRTATPPTPPPSGPPAAAAPVATPPVEPPPTPPAAAPVSAPVEAPPAAPPRPFLAAKEATEYHRLVTKKGLSHKEAMEMIQAQRDFLQRFGLPSGEQVRTSVGDRNAAGRWPE